MSEERDCQKTTHYYGGIYSPKLGACDMKYLGHTTEGGRMSDEKKPDGWVAWHPSSGVTIACLSRTACEHKLSGVKHGDFQRYEEFSTAHEAELNRALNDGWRIRPVKLVFLDEEKSE